MARGIDDTGQPDRAYQHSFRIAAAGLIKSLIRARTRQTPKFLTAAEYSRWDVTKLAEEKRSCDYLLKRVRRLHDRFEKRFLQEQDSIPDPASGEDADSFDLLVERIATFINVNELDKAILSAANDKRVSWNQLAEWKSLDNLRDALDRLPSVSVAKGSEVSKPVWDDATEARNKWIYKECVKITPYVTIILRLKDKPKSWERIGSTGGIRRAAAAYATRHSLPPLPKRQAGRKKQMRAD